LWLRSEQRQLRAGSKAQLAEDLRQLRAHVNGRDAKAIRDLLIREALGNEPSHPRFAQAESLQTLFLGHRGGRWSLSVMRR
jgi:hypothetical protein